MSVCLLEASLLPEIPLGERMRVFHYFEKKVSSSIDVEVGGVWFFLLSLLLFVVSAMEFFVTGGRTSCNSHNHSFTGT